MTLKWNREHGDLFAVGRRGRYSITHGSIGTRVLTATGYDGLPLLDLPPFGAVYLTEWLAKLGADELESRYVVEPEMSGT
jgi:hypothetical protein